MIKVTKFSSKKRYVKVTFAKWRLICLGDKELNTGQLHKSIIHQMIYSSEKYLYLVTALIAVIYLT